MHTTPVFRLLVGLSLLAGGTPALAAGSGPSASARTRAAWLDRYAEARQGPESTDRLTRTFKVGPRGALDLTGISGDVTITGGGGSDIRVEATKRVRHRDSDEARRLVDELRVETAQFGERVEVRTVYPRRSRGYDRGSSASIDYVVSVPKDASVTVRNVSGDVVVTSVAGDVRAETVSGDVEVRGAPSLAAAKTVSGDVTVRDVGNAGTLVLGTVSGTIVASGLKARALECGSVSGDVRIQAAALERAAAKSLSGTLEFESTLARGGRYELTSHSGDIRIVVGGGAGFELDASTFSGSVRSDLPVTLRPPTGDRERRRGDTRAIHGTHGDAGAFLSVRSFSGSVVIVGK